MRQNYGILLNILKRVFQLNKKYINFYKDLLFRHKTRFITAIIFMFLFSTLNTSIVFVVKSLMDDVFINAALLSRGKNIKKTKIFDLKRMLSKKAVSIKDQASIKNSTHIKGKEAVNYLLHSLILVALIFISITLLKELCWYIRRYSMLYIGESVVRDLRNGIYTHIQHLSVRYFDKAQTGEIMSRITNDVTLVQQTIATAGTHIIQEPINFIFAFGVLFYLNYKMTVIALITIVILIYPVDYLSRIMKKAAQTSQKKIGNLSSIMQEIISGIRIVKAFNMEKYEIEKFKKTNKEYFKAMMKGNSAKALLTPTNEILASIAISAALIIGGFEIINGKMTTGTFFAYFFALFSMYAPLRSITNASSTLKRSQASIDRINEILNEEIKVKEKEKPTPINNFSDIITFKDVYYAYDDKNWILNNMNFSIKKGETIAFVGESGAGKSTIASLFLRFYDVNEGKIIIDKVDIRDYCVNDLRNLIGYVSQETFLFNDTIRNNIIYGKEKINENEIIKAAKNSGSYDFIMSLPNKFDTMIGERGYALSGGQRQRIAIARALIKNPGILILDEATSALDTESEKLVQNALNVLMKGRTNIIIAHRLSTVANADRIMVLSNGKIVETGSHKSLLEIKGYYWKLYNIR